MGFPDGGHAREDEERALYAAAGAFAGGDRIAGIEPLGAGLIHASFAVRLAGHSGPRELVLQRLNREVFGEPERLMENLRRVTRHLHGKLQSRGEPEVARRCLTLVPDRHGADLHRDSSGVPWRAFPRIERALSRSRPADAAQAEAAARAFGRFARDLADLPAPPLHETLPGFHDFAARLAALEAAARADRVGRAAGVEDEIRALLAQGASLVRELEAAGFATLPLRIAHHDCKLDNLLFDARDGTPLCVIDLDTTMPGRLLSDFGELVRSSTSSAPEDEPDLRRVDFDLGLHEALARGYGAGVGPLIEASERATLPLAGPLMTLMNAVRFLTDHLKGDVYFRTERPDHNLDRARAQRRLAEHMRSAGAGLRRGFEAR